MFLDIKSADKREENSEYDPVGGKPHQEERSVEILACLDLT